MKEIQIEIESIGQDTFPTLKTLIVTEDDRTCLQLRKIIECGSREFLQNLFSKSRVERENTGNKGLKRSPQEVEESVEHVDQAIIVQPLRCGTDPFALHKTLFKVRPRFIVMYDCDVSFVRQV